MSVKHVLPVNGFVFEELDDDPVLCKPKIIPLKSFTLKKLEKLQKESQESIRQKTDSEARTREVEEAAPKNNGTAWMDGKIADTTDLWNAENSLKI